MNKTLEVIAEDASDAAKAFATGFKGMLYPFYFMPSTQKKVQDAFDLHCSELKVFVEAQESKGISHKEAVGKYYKKRETHSSRHFYADFFGGGLGFTVAWFGPGLVYSSLIGENHMDLISPLAIALPLMAATNALDAIHLYAKNVSQRAKSNPQSL